MALTLDIWYQSLAGSGGRLDDIETVEAEVVYLLRRRYRQWPEFQTEIHFHSSTAAHRKIARQVLGVYAK